MNDHPTSPWPVSQRYCGIGLLENKSQEISQLVLTFSHMKAIRRRGVEERENTEREKGEKTYI